MKLDAVLRVIAPMLATDHKPEDVRRAILAADKKARDAAGSGLGARELEEKDKAEDRARDEREAETDEREQAADEREAALDEREEAHDSAEEAEDEGKEDGKAKDRKGARDARKGARDARKGARDARMGARDSRKGARDKRAKDRDDDPERTNDEDYLEGSDPSTPGGNRGGKQAVDSAEVDRRINAAVMARDALHAALREVEPILGTGITYDSAPKAYRAALERMGVDVKGVHDSALPAMLKLAKDKAQAAPATPAAMDSAQAIALAQAIPGYSRLP